MIIKCWNITTSGCANKYYNHTESRLSGAGIGLIIIGVHINVSKYKTRKNVMSRIKSINIIVETKM